MELGEEMGLLVSLLREYSPAGSADSALGILSDYLSERGLEPRVEDGVLACGTGGGEPAIIFLGHVDTVPGLLPVEVRRGVVSGRGAVDAKGPLAAMACALVRLSDLGGVMLGVVSDEEAERGSGVEKLIGMLPRSPKYAVVGEPTRGRGVAVSYHGKLSFWLRVEGRRAHVSASVAIPSAIESCMRAYLRIKGELEKRMGRVPVAPTLIRGGDYRGFLPRSCRVFVDVRVPPGFSVQQARRIVLSSLVDLNSEVEVEWSSSEEPLSTPVDSALVRAFQEAIREVFRQQPMAIRKLGTSDFNTVGARMGIPVVAYGPGNPRLSHTDIERLLVSEYLSSIEVLVRASEKLLEGVGGA